MSENIHEQVVETYLAMERSVFLHPQYFVGEQNGWNAELDFLAICFLETTAWMVEVTRQGSRLDNKIAEFVRDYEPRIREQLVTDQVIPKDAGNWMTGFWAFVPEWDRSRVQRLCTQAAIPYFKVTPLEHALSLSAWEYRFPKTSN